VYSIWILCRISDDVQRRQEQELKQQQLKKEEVSRNPD
jgi:hypothetical protein